MPDLKDKLNTIGEEIKSLDGQAKSAWAEFAQFRDELAKSDIDVTAKDFAESDVFKKADEKHREFAGLSERLADLKGQQQKLYAMTADAGTATNADVKRVETDVKDAIASGWSDLAVKALQADGYRDLQEKGILNEGSRIAIGNVVLGKQASTAEAKAVILEGSPQSVNSATNGGVFNVPQRVGYYPMLQRPLMLADLVTVGQTNTSAVEFVTQTSLTNASAFTAESTSSSAGGTGVKPESAMAFAVTQAPVRTLAHWIPATRQALADAGQLQTIIEQQLRYGLNYVLDAQMVNGDGTGQNLTGIVNTAGISTQARGTDTDVDAIHKAITLIRLNYAEPNAVALHPNNWETIRLAKDSTGQYYYGPPAISGTSQVWGLPVVTGAQFAAGTAIVGDFRQAILWLREGIQVLASDSHSDFFVKNLIAILAELRAAFGVVRPQAFATVTSLN